MTGDTSNYTDSTNFKWVSSSTSDVTSINKNLKEKEDYYWEEINGDKYRVFTSKYLYERGFCCGNGCKNCPYKKTKKY